MIRLIPVILVCAAANSGCGREAPKKTSEPTGKASWRKAWCAVPSPILDKTEFSEIVTLFEQTMAPKADRVALTRKWVAKGFELKEVKMGDDPVWILSEPLDKLGGKGVYAIRRGTAKPVLLQAPHSKADVKTGDIVSILFKENRLRAACWNTVHRKQRDMSHATGTHFQAFTKSFAKTYNKSMILQLHGFAAGKRETKAGETADVIVSSGSELGSVVSQSVATALDKATIGTVRLFPTQVSELGATTNVQGKMLRAMGYLTFVHIELNAPTRKRLQEDGSVRKRFMTGCLSVIVPARGGGK